MEMRVCLEQFRGIIKGQELCQFSCRPNRGALQSPGYVFIFRPGGGDSWGVAASKCHWRSESPGIGVNNNLGSCPSISKVRGQGSWILTSIPGGGWSMNQIWDFWEETITNTAHKVIDVFGETGTWAPTCTLSQHFPCNLLLEVTGF